MKENTLKKIKSILKIKKVNKSNLGVYLDYSFIENIIKLYFNSIYGSKN